MDYKELISTKLTILICEENERILKRITLWVKAMGEKVYTTSNGVEALEIYKNQKPDIVITATSLKNMSGIELLDKVFEINKEQATIVVFDTIEHDTFKTVINLGVDKFISKPIEAKTLYKVILDLEKEKVWRDEFLQLQKDITKNEIEKRESVQFHSDEINRLKDSMLTVFTHELKTPLNAIVNFSKHVHKHLSKEEFSKRDQLLQEIEEIQYSGTVMTNLIANVMDAYKLRDGSIVLNIEELEIKTLCQNIMTKFSYELKTNELELNIEDPSLLFKSDSVQFEKIISNLLSNSFKYGKGKVLVSFTTSNGAFSCCVADNGDGFLEKDKSFDLFEQASSDEMTRTAQGTGVGLFIIKELCEILGYNIEIKNSEILGGAKVIISGPLEVIQN
jgi:signal transduction histidine kinase